MSDPNNEPMDLADALRNPDEFVAGMAETTTLHTAAEPAKHTPGPWVARVAPCGTRLGLMAASGKPIAMLGMINALNPADVRLIEHGPDLLRELISLRRLLSTLHERERVKSPVPAVLAGLALADLVIAKATTS